MDTYYADDIALLANSSAKAENLGTSGTWHRPPCQRRQREHMCFNQRGNISTLKSGPLKIVDKLTYRRKSVSSTENDINTRLSKAWAIVARISIIWNSDLTDKIKQFFPSCGCADAAL